MDSGSYSELVMINDSLRGPLNSPLDQLEIEILSYYLPPYCPISAFLPLPSLQTGCPPRVQPHDGPEGMSTGHCAPGDHQHAGTVVRGGGGRG